jgi:hypothetical protein
MTLRLLALALALLASGAAEPGRHAVLVHTTAKAVHFTERVAPGPQRRAIAFRRFGTALQAMAGRLTVSCIRRPWC